MMTFVHYHDVHLLFSRKKVTYLSRKIGRVSIFKEESGNTKALTKKCRLDLKYFFKKIKIKPYYLLLFLTSLYKYRESPHKTVNWETEQTVLCEIVLFQIENRVIAKNSTMWNFIMYYERNWNISKSVL